MNSRVQRFNYLSTACGRAGRGLDGPALGAIGQSYRTPEHFPVTTTNSKGQKKPSHF